MNRIVRDHYPVSKLPDDLKHAAAPATHVRLTIEADPAAAKTSPKRFAGSRIEALGIDLGAIEPVPLSDIRKIARPIGTTPGQAVRRIRRLRADRDDR